MEGLDYAFKAYEYGNKAEKAEIKAKLINETCSNNLKGKNIFILEKLFQYFGEKDDVVLVKMIEICRNEIYSDIFAKHDKKILIKNLLQIWRNLKILMEHSFAGKKN